MVSISLGFPYLVMLQTCKHKQHCSGYGVASGCYGRCIVLWNTTGTSQWYCRYCFTEKVRTSVGQPATYCNANLRRSRAVNRKIICRISKRSVPYSWITPHIWLDAIYMIGDNKCSGFRPAGSLSSWWLIWWRHAHTGTQFIDKLLDLSYYGATTVVFIDMFYWI